MGEQGERALVAAGVAKFRLGNVMSGGQRQAPMVPFSGRHLRFLMLRLFVALLIPAPVLAQGLPASISIGGITLSTNGQSVRVSSRVGGVTVAGGGRASTGRPAGKPSPGKTSSAASATRVLSTADRYVGTPYVWGGTTPKGFDCSGFVQYVFARHEVELPRTSRQQAVVGTKLSARPAGLRRGDLLFFAQSGKRVDHVAIYAGNNRIIHSTSSGGGVRYDDLSTKRGKWFVSRMVGARRVIANGASLIDALDAELRLLEALDPPDRAPAPAR